MALGIASTTGREAERSLAVLRALFGPAFALNFSVRLWDETVVPAREAEDFTFVVNEPFALRAAFLPPLDLNPGRAFVEGWIDLEGNAEAGIDTFSRAIDGLSKTKLPGLLGRLLRLPKPPAVAAVHEARLSGARHS